MAQKVARLIMTLLGALLGPALVGVVDEVLTYLGLLTLNDLLLPWGMVLIYIATGLITAIIINFLSPKLIDAFVSTMSQAENQLSELDLSDIFFGVLGLIIGLLVAFLVSTLMNGITLKYIKFIISTALYISLGYLGWAVVIKRRNEINIPNLFSRRGGKGNTGKHSNMARPKILDTSVIIDGRIADICATGVLEGQIVVPAFVLQELRHIADSADALKRNRGRRGLDILNHMQKELNIHIKVVENDYEDIAEVDAKLIKLAYDMNGVVVTNDYNLNKVAGVQHVPVFNINELANAIKPVLLPGEEMHTMIMKEGKEAGQGIAYLDDGTMIVVDGGRKFVGDSVHISVTSVLQTSAGRMIFAKLKQS